MTRQQASVLWPAVKAWGEGESVQVLSGKDWTDIPSDPTFSPNVGEWRVKPKPREFWVVVNVEGEILYALTSPPDRSDLPRNVHSIIHCIEVTTP